MDLYRENILDHYKNPRNFGHLPESHVKAEAYNATCGDRIVMEIKVGVHLKKEKIEDVRFSGEGCAISQASASLLTEKIKHMDIDAILRFKASDIVSMLGIPLTPTRMKCALLPLEVLHQAIGIYHGKALY